MKHPNSFVLTVAALIGAMALPVQAGEETLNFRLVTRTIASNVHDDPRKEGLELTAAQSIGVAVFEDGRIAYKEFVNIAYAGENAPARMPGFSSYTFENGDSLQVSFLFGPGDGGFFVDYTILAGTGAYSGATGSGQIAIAEADWGDATLWKGSLEVVTP